MRKMKTLSVAFFALTSTACSLDTKPWFGEVYEFSFEGTYDYSRFRRVEGASRQLTSPINNQSLFADFGFTSSSSIDLQVEGELGRTTDIGWTFRSAAVQARYRVLDDIAGDPLTLTFGLIFRGAAPHMLTDVSTPYAAELNTEATCSLGKEWSSNEFWAMRTYGFASIGQANSGYPWTRELLVGQYNLNDIHRFTVFFEGYFGFGNRRRVDVKHFRGWGKYRHQSMDLGLSYGYKIGLYGVITASYAHRVFAHNYPEHVNFFTLSYHLPFSLL